MPLIYGAALATLIGGTAAVAMVWWERRGQYPWAALAFMLPTAVVANYLVKRPLFTVVFRGWLGFSSLSLVELPLLWAILRFLTVPLTEELIKAAPAWLPWLREHRADGRSRCLLGFVLGSGYGISEVWLLAIAVLLSGQAVPAAATWGFFGERSIAIVTHGASTLIVVSAMGQGALRLLLSYGLAVLLHGLINVPAALYQARLLDLRYASTFVSLAGLVIVITAGVVASRYRTFVPSRQQVLWRRDDDNAPT